MMPWNVMAIVVAIVSMMIYGRMVVIGYYTALLPLLCSLLFIILEVDWAISGSREFIGQFKDIAWSFFEMGMLGGGALLSWTIIQDHKSIGESIRKELEDNDS